MKNKYRSGSSTVLVIMIVVTLAVFGVFAVMSSSSEKNLARMNYKAAQGYYELYGESNRILAFMANHISKTGFYDTENLMRELSLEFNSATEVRFEKKSDRLFVSMELKKKRKIGLPYQFKIEFRDHSGEYEVLSSRLLPTEIEIDEIEKFEIVE